MTLTEEPWFRLHAGGTLRRIIQYIALTLIIYCSGDFFYFMLLRRSHLRWVDPTSLLTLRSHGTKDVTWAFRVKNDGNHLQGWLPWKPRSVTGFCSRHWGGRAEKCVSQGDRFYSLGWAGRGKQRQTTKMTFFHIYFQKAWFSIVTVSVIKFQHILNSFSQFS